jgi:tetratricopeptide (TPR) repeat protein
VKLVDAVARNVLWTDQRTLKNVQEAHHYHQLSVQILSLVVERVEREELARYDVEQNPTAYHFFLLGQRCLRTLDLPSVRKARRAFREAITACSDFVPAISGLARTLQLEWLLRAHGDGELLLEAQKLATRSIEIDPDDSRGYRELGICRAYAGQFDESLEALAQGEHRNPQHADLLNDFSDALVHACEPATALLKIEQAIELNPLCPDQYWWAAAGAHYQLERYSEAVECMSRMRDQTPALRLLAASWGMLGDQNRAGKYARMTKEIHPDFNIGSWFSIMPFRDSRIVGKYKEGLRAAGFE